MILAGDIGGTNTRLAAFREGAGGALEEAWARTYASQDADGLMGILRRALADSGLAFEAATFGVAGPVKDGVCKTTNLPWVVDARELAAALGLRRVGLLNDLE